MGPVNSQVFASEELKQDSQPVQDTCVFTGLFYCWWESIFPLEFFWPFYFSSYLAETSVL